MIDGCQNNVAIILNGNIEEELYMVQPERFVDPKDAGKVSSFSGPFMD